ncbi:hypothetical protein [Puia sp.]|jgi:hypothetical protein|uniref:hypothetical protein n=1 Tax=Puia sp. TaxID=2045100 RepID=UPI002F40EE52
MKLTYILWSLVILAATIFVPGLFYRTNAKLGGGPDLVAFFLLIWIITSIVSPLVILLKKVGATKGDIGFIRTLLTTFNLYFGTYGIYMISVGQITQSGPFLIFFLILNLIWAVLFIIMALTRHRKNASQH